MWIWTGLLRLSAITLNRRSRFLCRICLARACSLFFVYMSQVVLSAQCFHIDGKASSSSVVANICIASDAQRPRDRNNQRADVVYILQINIFRIWTLCSREYRYKFKNNRGYEYKYILTRCLNHDTSILEIIIHNLWWLTKHQQWIHQN